MAKYRFTHKATGACWGTFEGATEHEAYVELLRDAGYRSKSDALAADPASSIGNFEISEVE